ncbi:hypothetical protein PROSTU_04731 [Providencia stuartii ATCC 25827]|uniref:Uncharacterized protein n=1 Tax=Providencia stuartii ATCC 25827 TaxID=471874 RepID=A0AA86YEE7_PROST|nr:hypothetical protein PROSTU_04731 [Providencia stuartii ATCC 25827]
MFLFNIQLCFACLFFLFSLSHSMSDLFIFIGTHFFVFIFISRCHYFLMIMMLLRIMHLSEGEIDCFIYPSNKMSE